MPRARGGSVTAGVPIAERCIRCGARTPTAVGFEGTGEELVALVREAGHMPHDVADAIVKTHAMDAWGCAPGVLPFGTLTFVVRLCRRCARGIGLTVREGERVETYRVATA
jgi:hypothetical protein